VKRQGRIQWLSCHVYRFHPVSRRGSHPSLIFIRPLFGFAGRITYPLDKLYHTPLGYMSREKMDVNFQNHRQRVAVLRDYIPLPVSIGTTCDELAIDP
jgi:hypothetical protein